MSLLSQGPTNSHLPAMAKPSTLLHHILILSDCSNTNPEITANWNPNDASASMMSDLGLRIVLDPVLGSHSCNLAKSLLQYQKQDSSLLGRLLCKFAGSLRG